MSITKLQWGRWFIRGQGVIKDYRSGGFGVPVKGLDGNTIHQYVSVDWVYQYRRIKNISSVRFNLTLMREIDTSSWLTLEEEQYRRSQALAKREKEILQPVKLSSFFVDKCKGHDISNSGDLSLCRDCGIGRCIKCNNRKINLNFLSFIILVSFL